ncbi:MAG: hypothetical protein EXS00_07290 [Phycisphaerales bacterium]|nr:hypothetical protein [Phycisphaerales bacterium]
MTTRTCTVLLAAAFIAESCLAAHAAPDQLQRAQEAEQLYEHGAEMQTTDLAGARQLFESSASMYKEVVDSGIENSALWFNLGNAYGNAGEWGQAIGAYLQSQRLDPGNQANAANLAHARAAVAQSIQVADTSLLSQVTSAWQTVSLSTRTHIAIASWLLAWAVITIGISSRWPARIPWHILIVTSATAFAVTGSTVVIDMVRQAQSPPGVLIRGEVIARKGNGEGFTPAFAEPLSEGIEFTLIGRRPGWLHINLADGKECWVRSGDAVVADGTNGEGEIRTHE